MSVFFGFKRNAHHVAEADKGRKCSVEDREGGQCTEVIEVAQERDPGHTGEHPGYRSAETIIAEDGSHRYKEKGPWGEGVPGPRAGLPEGHNRLWLVVWVQR